MTNVVKEFRSYALGVLSIMRIFGLRCDTDWNHALKCKYHKLSVNPNLSCRNCSARVYNLATGAIILAILFRIGRIKKNNSDSFNLIVRIADPSIK